MTTDDRTAAEQHALSDVLLRLGLRATLARCNDELRRLGVRTIGEGAFLRAFRARYPDLGVQNKCYLDTPKRRREPVVGRAKPPCKHCGGIASRPRGLCGRCYSTPAIRKQYPTAYVSGVQQSPCVRCEERKGSAEHFGLCDVCRRDLLIREHYKQKERAS